MFSKIVTENIPSEQPKFKKIKQKKSNSLPLDEPSTDGSLTLSCEEGERELNLRRK